MTPSQRQQYSERIDYLYLHNKLSLTKAQQAAMSELLPEVKPMMDLAQPPRPSELAAVRKKNEVEIDYIRDMEWVYMTMGLKGPALEAAKADPPSGGAAAQLEWALEDAKNRKTILDQMRALQMAQARLDKGAKKKVTSRAILALVDDCLAKANADAGVLPAGSEVDSAEPSISA